MQNTQYKVTINAKALINASKSVQRLFVRFQLCNRKKLKEVAEPTPRSEAFL